MDKKIQKSNGVLAHICRDANPHGYFLMYGRSIAREDGRSIGSEKDSLCSTPEGDHAADL